MIWVYDTTQQMEETSPKATQLKKRFKAFPVVVEQFCCMYVFPFPRLKEDLEGWIVSPRF